MSYIQLQKVDINGVSQPYDIAVCGTASNFTPIGGIATALANKAEFYTGNVVDELNLPIGSYICAYYSARTVTLPTINSVITPYLPTNDGDSRWQMTYRLEGTLDRKLSGVWANRGSVINSPSTITKTYVVLLQRIQ